MGDDYRLRLLGPVQIERDEGPVRGFVSRKALGLLSYMSLQEQPVSRSHLADLFWGDKSEARGRANLSRVLHNLSTLLPDCLQADRHTVQFRRPATIWLDVAAFEDLVASSQTDYLAEAVALYRGDFMAGFFLNDCPEFETWLVVERERWHQRVAQLLQKLIDHHRQRGEPEQGLSFASRLLELDPWREEAHQRMMLLLAQSGQRTAALAQYEFCRRTLAEELDVEPAEETTILYERIRDGDLSKGAEEQGGKEDDFSSASLYDLPPFLKQEVEPAEVEGSVFVARERELAQLDGFLGLTLANRGRVVFVTGEAGSGKTALVQEFAWRAQEVQPELIVASGNCTAFSGTGDPYLPFRDVMGMLTGDVEARWAAGTITRDQARRLWYLSPVTVQALIEAGPNLIDVFVPGAALVGWARTTVPDETAWLERLKELTVHKPTGPIGLDQSYLFEQYARVLHAVAAQHPLLITLDDLQWADAASIRLLFHLGRRIEGSRILIVGAYRPDEVALGWDGERHPLEKVLGEFKRTFGDIWVELTQAAEGDEGRRFVDVLLDTQPNQLGEGFRQALFRQTGGHPLFTIELLRAMQARGDLVQDEERRWVAAPILDWRQLPARVEGVIEERIGRLEAELREILAVASVEGANFTAEVVAQVQGLSQRQLLRHLSQELEKRHRLVREREEVKASHQLLSRYQFAHILFQRYLYDSLSAGERRLLHGEIAQALTAVYEGHTDEIAAQLVYHFLEAGERVKTIEYTRQAARRAEAVYAYDEASQHLQTALDLLESGEQIDTQLALLEELADIYGLLRKDAQAISLYQTALEQWSSLAGADEMIVARLHRKILQTAVAMKWYAEFEQFEALSETLSVSRAYLEASLPLAESESPHLELVHVLTTLANDTGIRLPPALDTAERYAQAAVDLAEQLDALEELSDALQILAGVYSARGLLPQRLEISRRRLALSRDPRFGDVRKRIDILEHLSDALMLVGEYAQAIPYVLEAESLASKIGAVDRQVWALNLQAHCWYRLDGWDELFKVDEKRRELEQRYPPEQIGSICSEISYSAAAWALRGDLNQARILREQAYAIMVRLAGGSPDSWERSQHF